MWMQNMLECLDIECNNVSNYCVIPIGGACDRRNIGRKMLCSQLQIRV